MSSVVSTPRPRRPDQKSFSAPTRALPTVIPSRSPPPPNAADAPTEVVSNVPDLVDDRAKHNMQEIGSYDLSAMKGLYTVADRTKEPLGRGAQGIVYKVRDVRSQEKDDFYALKIMERTLKWDLDNCDNLSQELPLHFRFSEAEGGVHGGIVKPVWKYSNLEDLRLPGGGVSEGIYNRCKSSNPLPARRRNLTWFALSQCLSSNFARVVIMRSS